MNVNAEDGSRKTDRTEDIASYELGDRSIEDVRCTNCSGIYCGRRNIRVVDGEPLCICNLKWIGGKN